MGDDQKGNKLFELIQKHPTIAKLTSRSGGVILLIVLNKLTGFIDEIDFNNIIKWISKLKSLIEREYILSISLVIIISVFICVYKILYDKERIKEKILKSFGEIVKEDKTISKVTLINEKTNTNISISIERKNNTNTNTNTLDKENNSNIINFPSRSIK